MKILITTFGTRGDIQPFIALAKGLLAAGYEIALATAQGFQRDVEAHHVPYAYMDNTLLELTESVLDDSRGMGNMLSSIRQMGPAIRRMMDDEWAAVRDFQPDVIIYHPKCLGSIHTAEKLGIPAMLSVPLPYAPTREFAMPFFTADLGPRLNRLTYQITGLSSAMYANSVNDFRKKTLKLPPVGRFADWMIRANGEPVPMLNSYSPQVVPVPEDYLAHVHVTGYWFLDHDPNWQPDPALLDFLDAGPAPIYIGFGSVSARNARKRTQHVLDAARATGQRVVFASGWGDVDTADFPDHVFALKSVPHDWLFPRMQAVAHHGGAGTTAAGLRAGKPTIICPFLGDQPFWGKRVYDLGVGPQPIPQGKITADKLSQAIIQVIQDEDMQQRAAELGAKIRAEDGIACAINVITETVLVRP